MPRRKAVTLTRPELPERSYDFSKKAEEDGDGPTSSEAGVVGGPGKKEKKSAAEKNIPLLFPPLLRGGKRGFIFPAKNGTKEPSYDAKEEDLDRLLGELLALPTSLRRDLLARLSLAEKESRTGKGRDLEMWSGAVYAALVVAVGAGGEVGAGPASLCRLLGESPSWGPVSAFLRGTGLSELPVLRLQSVLNMLASLLVEHAHGAARRAGVPLTPRFVAACSANLAPVFDAAFPGYAASPRLVAVVAERLTQRRGDAE